MLRVDYGKNMNPVCNHLLAQIVKIPRSLNSYINAGKPRHDLALKLFLDDHATESMLSYKFEKF